jgi:hypothetical protein
MNRRSAGRNVSQRAPRVTLQCVAKYGVCDTFDLSVHLSNLTPSGSIILSQLSLNLVFFDINV